MLSSITSFITYPRKKKPTANLPLKHHQSTQTEELEPKNTVDLPGPHYIQHEPGMIKPPEDTSALETTLDQLIKSMNDLAQTIK